MKDEDTGRTGASAPEHPAMRPGTLLWRVLNAWQRRQRAALAPFALTPVQYLLLAGLAAAEDEGRQPTQAALARRCGTDPMMTSQVLRALAAAGLVERRAHGRDGRAVTVVLTAKGGELVTRARPEVTATENEFFAALGGDVPAFADALRLLLGERPRRRVRAGSA